VGHQHTTLVGKLSLLNILGAPINTELTSVVDTSSSRHLWEATRYTPTSDRHCAGLRPDLMFTALLYDTDPPLTSVRRLPLETKVQ
jgi:hypothetical protein